MLIKRQILMPLMKLRLGILVTDLSRVWNISGDLCTQTYYSWMKDGFKQFSFICLDRYRNSISKH